MAASLVVLYSAFSQSEAERVAALQPVLKHPPLTNSVEIKVRQPPNPFPIFHNLVFHNPIFHTEIVAAYPSIHVGIDLHF